jgi:hypothetical protein
LAAIFHGLSGVLIFDKTWVRLHFGPLKKTHLVILKETFLVGYIFLITELQALLNQ